jgi:hypothetical protein
MTSWKTVFGSYIKAEDLQGRAHTVSVESVTKEDVGKDGNKEMKLIARFVGKDKALILNRTNAESFEHAFQTSDYESWRGPLVLYPDTTLYGGKRVACIRVRPAAQSGQIPTFNPPTTMFAPTPQPSQPPLDAPPHITEDDIPF